MKLLFESWRGFLQEAALPDYSTLALAVFPSAKMRLLAFLLFDPAKTISSFGNPEIQKIILAERNDKVVSFINLSQAIIGTVMIDKDAPEHPCMGAKEVRFSAVSSPYQGKGYGKLLYTAAMQYLSRPIMADRGEISPEAERVWSSFEKDSGIGKTPPDDPAKGYTGQFDNAEAPKTPPKDDDCTVYPSSDAALNKAYFSNDRSVYQTLSANNTKFEHYMQQARGTDPTTSRMFEFFMLKRSTMALALFRKEYNK
jgi:hypothetical protein